MGEALPISGKITVSDGFPEREEKSGLNFSAAPSQLDHEEASKDFS